MANVIFISTNPVRNVVLVSQSEQFHKNLQLATPLLIQIMQVNRELNHKVSIYKYIFAEQQGEDADRQAADASMARGADK